jgi:putative transposase
MELLNNHGEKRMDRRKDMAVEAVLEQLIEHGPGDIASVFARAFELAMRIERERFLSAALYERTPGRQGYANGYKPKRIDTPAGTVSVQVPKTAGHDGEPFYPQSLERGRRSVRAVMLAVAEMYVKGVSTRQAEAVMREFGIESLSSSQVSRAAKLLDEELEAWRTRPLGEVKYIILDARYEKMRHGGVVRDAAVLSAIGIGADERRRVLGVSVALSEAEVHWRGFLESLVRRGLRGVEFITSDDHAGLRAARRAVLGGATWQRCQFHLAQNAIHHAPNAEIRKRIGAELRAVWNAGTLAKAEAALAELVASYRDSAPKLAKWLEENVPEGLAVFNLPEPHRRRLRTSNPMERAVQQELKRRTAKVRVFPSEDSLLRLVSAILVEIDEKWASDAKAYIKWQCQDA